LGEPLAELSLNFVASCEDFSGAQTALSACSFREASLARTKLSALPLVAALPGFAALWLGKNIRESQIAGSPISSTVNGRTLPARKRRTIFFVASAALLAQR
jgi:hypothetical protein